MYTFKQKLGIGLALLAVCVLSVGVLYLNHMVDWSPAAAKRSRNVPSLADLERTLSRDEFEKQLTPEQLQCHKRGEELARQWNDLLDRVGKHDKKNSFTADEIEEFRLIADQFEELCRKSEEVFPENIRYAWKQACSARWNYIDVLYRSGKREEACLEVPKLRQINPREINLDRFLRMSVAYVNEQFQAHRDSGLTAAEEEDYKFLVGKIGRENGGIRLACEVRVAYAAALHASARSEEAIAQLRDAMAIKPEICLTGPFLQAARDCGALNNAAFAEAFTSSGGDKKELTEK